VPWGAPRFVKRMPQAERAELLSRYGLTQPYALHFAAPDPRKNTLGLLAAWAEARAQVGDDWRLVMLGLEPVAAQQMADRAKALGVADRVVLLGFLDDGEIARLLACAQFLAYPSLAEGFGLPILEAWAAGTAVLTGNVTSLPEVAGDAALLVDPRDRSPSRHASLTQGLKRLMGDEDLRRRLAAKGRQRARQFTWRKAAGAFGRIVAQTAGVVENRRPVQRPTRASPVAYSPPAAPVDVLMVSVAPLWPMDQGYRVHGPQMAKALRESGMSVAVACLEPATTRPPTVLRKLLAPWPKAEVEDVQAFSQVDGGFKGRLRRRLTRHLGPSVDQLAGVLPLVRHYQPRVVIGVGILAPLVLQGLKGAKRIWYAADELVYFHASCLAKENLCGWPARLRRLLVHGLYERAFAPCLDGAVAASPLDAKLLRRVAGIGEVAVIRNGVDLQHFTPGAVEPAPRTLVFWGRLDFEPNVDAVCWFVQYVWPRVCGYRADAKLRIVGKNPHPRVKVLARVPGVELVGAVPDIRPYARRAAAVVLPMRCGGGIKNKLLEAAALGRPIIASPRAVRGLEMDKLRRPVLLAESPEDWAGAIRRLWGDSNAAAQLGARARAWAERNHSWSQAAEEFCRWLALSPARVQWEAIDRSMALQPETTKKAA